MEENSAQNLTKELIEAAGNRTLDELVAIHVFKWFVNKDHYWQSPDGGLYMPEQLPTFSRNGSRMIGVLEQMREMGWQCEITWTLVESPVVSFWQPYALKPMEGISIKSDGSMPFQVAKAALVAILAETKAPARH